MSYLKSVFSLTLLFLFSLNLSAQLGDVDEGCVPLEVKFSAPVGASSFSWDFGNGATSMEANPTYPFPNTGEFIVTFTDGTTTTTDTITVYEKPTVDFVADTLTGCAPLEVNFTSTSTIDSRIDITRFNWAFGDGTSGDGATIAHTYNAGSFKVGLELISSMKGCGSSDNKEDYIVVNPIPEINISADSTSSCTPPLNVNFSNNDSNNSNYTYFWDFGNSETSTERSPSEVTYDAPGTYNATLTVTDDKGCSRDSTIIINIGSPIVDILIGDTICASPIPQTVRNGSSNGDYSWTFSSPASPSVYFLRQPNVFFREEGFYDITLTVTDPDQGCSSTDTVRVYAEIPEADFTVDPSYSCDYPVDIVFTPNAPDILNLGWTIYDASLDSTYATLDSIATYGILRDTSTYGLNGARVLETTLRLTNSRGCIAFETKKDTFFAPNARFNTDTIMGCAPLEVTFYDSMSVSNEPITSYVYEWGDGTANSTFTTNDSVKHTFTQAGEYDVVLYIENSAGCIDTSYAVRIFVGEQVNADFTVDKTSICPGDSIQFMGIGDTTLIDDWHFDTDGSRMSHCADDRNPTWDFKSEAGTMDATLTVIYNGCPTMVEKTDLITVRGPIAQLDYLNDCDNKFEVVFADSSHEASTVTWDFGDGNSSTMSEPTHIYSETGDYQVILTASNPTTGCPDSRDTTMVHIRNLEAKFELEENYCQGEMIMFDASNSTDVNNTCWKGFTWFPSDSRPITTDEEMIDYAWTGIDTQTLELIVQDINGCQDTLRDTTTVWQVTAAAEADPLRLCAPNDVQFTDMSTGNGTIERWEWNFGDMTGTSNLQNPLYTYTTTPTIIDPDTTYTVTFIAFDSLNCSDTIPIIIDFYEPISEILLSDDAICVGDEVTYSATDFTSEGSFLNFKWFLNGDSINNTQSGTITFENDKIGDNTLRLEYTEASSGCTRITEVVINVQDFPDPTFTSPIDANPLNCVGQNVTYTAVDNTPGLTYNWDYEGDNNIQLGTATGVFNYSESNTYTVTLFVTSSNGCAANSSRDYTFVSPTGQLVTSDSIICQGQELTFDTTNFVDVSDFSIFIGGESFDMPPVSYTFDSARITPVILIMDLELDDGRICNGYDTLSIIVLDGGLSPMADDPNICQGESVELFLEGGSPDWDVTWTGNGIPDTDIKGDQRISVSPTETTRYEVELVGSTGSCSTSSVEINVTPVPTVTGDTIYTMVKEGISEVTLPALPDAVGGLDIDWGDPNLRNNLQPTITNFNGNPTEEYTAVVTSETSTAPTRECYSETFSRIISLAMIPNIFSPNNDDVNDYFQVFIDEDGAEINPDDIASFQVFNRWGQMVYNNETPATGWNGTYKNEQQISDVYVYKIVFINPDGSLSDPCEGDVTLYR